MEAGDGSPDGAIVTDPVPCPECAIRKADQSRGGIARSASMTKERRREIAVAAAVARWKKAALAKVPR